VPVHDFLFALELSDEAWFDAMVAELAGTVLGHVGFTAPAIDELTNGLRGALSAGAGRGQKQCDVRFRAHSGELKIVVSFQGLSEWHTTRALPAPSSGPHGDDASA
jgi:hypothetical protein